MICEYETNCILKKEGVCRGIPENCDHYADTKKVEDYRARSDRIIEDSLGELELHIKLHQARIELIKQRQAELKKRIKGDYHK